MSCPECEHYEAELAFWIRQYNQSITTLYEDRHRARLGGMFIGAAGMLGWWALIKVLF